MNEDTQLNLVLKRLEAIAKGATINGTYKMMPDEALVMFKADLAYIVGYVKGRK